MIRSVAVGAAASRDVQERLTDLTARVQPTVLAAEQRLPAPAPLVPLLPDGGLRRGTTLVVRGSMSLAMALVAEASAAGSWLAAANLPELGVAAAAEQGICLERFALVPAIPPARWAEVLAALVDSLDLILAASPAALDPVQARRLAARVRERRAVLVGVGDRWVGPVDLELSLTTRRWEGPDRGHGHLQARLAEVTSTGRGAASHASRVRLWLPDRHGRVARAE